MLKKTITAALAAATLCAPAIAQDAETQARSEMTDAERAELNAQLNMGVTVLSALMSGLQSENVSQSVKDALFLCMYDNSVGVISGAASKAIEADPALSADEPNDVFKAAIAGCGIEIRSAEEGAAPASDAQR